ncbi:hypothetical protein SAMN05660772_00602 [Pasteurella testudinis DSM 23072]|uniref:Lipoprotein n=2 Tax=Pasteurella testudinis TaxID=761 RepID=A0A1W1UQU6_9PAST|nr:DUF799 domain-containing protein [Pasteurella testudinis]SMB83495.1 hypothetical protein SAMN05660772_00602 [Pasteurella testudinis DSM 23072]SUB51072.1 Putative lipoprotein NMB1124/NMB1162 precursor [Pasteurella testudinis]
MKTLWILMLVLIGAVLSGCSTNSEPYDYSNFLNSKPRSILVLMPTNESTEVKAASAVLANTVKPLAEAGYYVFPVALANDTFRHNGVYEGHDIQQVSAKKLQEIFGADTALYLNVTQYGSTYMVIDSVTQVSVEGKLVDLRNGAVLWSGKAVASSSEQGNSNAGNPIATLITAAVKQIINTVADEGFNISVLASQRLLNSGYNGGLLYGPYSPHYGKDPQLNAR